jgi:hypothetical protein
MNIDITGKVYIIRTAEGDFVRVNLFPQREASKRMKIGTFMLEEKEAMKLAMGIYLYFTKSELLDYVEVKDLRGMKKANDEFRVKKEQANRSEPMSAQALQEQNLRAEGRLEAQMTNDVAEVKKKELR